MTYTLLEEQFFPYPWCQRLLRGLNEEARKKRIEITQMTNLEEKPSEFGCVLLIGATSSWVNTMAEKARAVGLHPIVMTNRQPGASPFPFSSVMMDIQGSMQLAVQICMRSEETGWRFTGSIRWQRPTRGVRSALRF